MNWIYLITHGWIAQNVSVLALFFAFLLGSLAVFEKFRSWILRPAVFPLLGLLIVLVYLFGQSPDVAIWAMLLSGAVLTAYVFLEVAVVPLTRAQIVVLAALAVLFFLLRLPDESVTYLGVSLIFAGLLLAKFIGRNKSRRFKIWSAVVVVALIFTATYLTHAYYARQARKIVEAIGDTARLLLEAGF